MCAPTIDQRNALFGIGLGLRPRGKTNSLAVGGMFGSGTGYPQKPLGFGLLAEASKPRKRRVFFSFHYENDINRVNVVRQSWRFRPEDQTQPADWFDHSLWEATKKTGAAALKRLINGGMNNTSVTCVLAGTDTWRRPWVRYEIAYALFRGNGLFGVYIDNVQCMQKGLCERGNNPFDHIALGWDDDGKAYIWEKFGGVWRKFALLPDAVKWPTWLPNVTSREFVMPLSAGVRTYDYVVQNGYANLSVWANAAAEQAGR